MKYEWESSVSQEAFDHADYELPGDLVVIGLVVANESNVEGAIVLNPEMGPLAWPQISWADLCKDVLGDAQRRYDAAVEALNAPKPRAS